MNNKFDELTKSLAQSVTRRAALKKFGVGLAGMALACFGLANRAEAQGKCWQAGVLCYSGFLSGGLVDSDKNCGRCCSGSRRCYGSWGRGDCYCQ